MIDRLRNELRVFGHAVALLTRVSLPSFRFDPRLMARSVIYFPLVGGLIGAASAAVLLLAAQAWSGWIPAILAVAASVALTGGLHEDGLADSFDALGAGPGPDARRAVLKDSRLGTYGALALFFVLALKLAALAAMAPGEAALALVAGHALGRWASVALLARLPYLSGREGSGSALLKGLGGRRLALTSLTALVVAALALGWAALPAAGLTVVVTLAVGAHQRRTLGGVTGDGLGAGCQLVETAVYLLLVPLHPPWLQLPGLPGGP